MCDKNVKAAYGDGVGQINAVSIDQFIQVDILNSSRRNNASCIYSGRVNFKHDNREN